MLSFTQNLFAYGLLMAAPLASAYTHPTGGEPKGNPIYTPNLGTQVPAGKEYNVTWGPTTSGKVDIVLLKGPSSNAVPQYALAEGIENTGSFIWTPKTDLPSQDTGYGLMIVVDGTGQFQYSPQFGISNSKVSSPGSTSSGTASAEPTSSGSTASMTSSVASHTSSTSSGAAHETTGETTSSTESKPTSSGMVTSAKPTSSTPSSTTSSGATQATQNSASGLIANTVVVAAVAGALGLAF